jgi:flagellar M-ring protein FliF
MPLATGTTAATGLAGFVASPGGRKVLLMLGAAAIVAVMSGVWMWGQQPDFKVLFSNLPDRDGGAIVVALQQMNIPYKFADGGGAILVPAEHVHDARLKLASQGLPKGGNVGFELMENQKFGVSQFLEQVNFQRALEGELARSIQSVAAVDAARVHLALPKASVFVRDQKKPTASVLLNLHPGRTLDQQQVSAIVHLVASGVPDLPAQNVTVVDQNGVLLSDTSKSANAGGLDATQLKYVQELQQSIVKRIETIVTPIVGENNVRAEATADVDFSRIEQAAETYKPNQSSDAASIRSQQTSESQAPFGSSAGGVPGALSNQPPNPATAPINSPTTAPSAALPNAAATTTSNSSRKDSTVNYEVDKTIRYVQQPMGGIRRLSVAVVVNHKKETDASGTVVSRPLSDIEKAQITDLVKEAMGFNKDRGDSLNVVNSPFAIPDRAAMPDSPLWRQPEKIQMAKDGGRYLIVGGVLVYLFFAFLRPLMRRMSEYVQTPLRLPGADGSGTGEYSDAELIERNEARPGSYQQNLEKVRQLAKQEPKMVASVVKTWVSGND